MTIVTAGVLLLAASLALAAVDVVRAVASVGRAQGAADAAALAAAQQLAIPAGGWSPADAAAWYAERNGATVVECRCEPGSSEAVVSVVAPVDLVFVGLDRTVSARARAVVGP